MNIAGTALVIIGMALWFLGPYAGLVPFNAIAGIPMVVVGAILYFIAKKKRGS
jgi:membrane-bound ClpP family serine protease